MSQIVFPFPPSLLPAVACGLLLAIGFQGTVEAKVRRRITIRSNPPGALVFIDDQEIGITPVSTRFVYYGTRKIQLLKDGYETLTVKQTFRPPWYQFTPLDFVSENLWPSEVRDERILDFQLIPQRNVPNEELRARGEDLRRMARQGVVTPLPGFQGSINPGSQLAPQTPAGELPPPAETLPPGGMPLPPPQPPANTLPPNTLPPNTLPPNTLPPAGRIPPQRSGMPGQPPPPLNFRLPSGVPTTGVPIRGTESVPRRLP